MHGKALFEAEEKAKAAKKNVWEDYVEPPPQEEEEGEEGQGEVVEGENQQAPQLERKCNYQKVWGRGEEGCVCGGGKKRTGK